MFIAIKLVSTICSYLTLKNLLLIIWAIGPALNPSRQESLF